MKAISDKKYFEESEWMDRYVKHPSFCPYCEHRRIEVISDFFSHRGYGFRDIKCHNCDRSWRERFGLTAIEEIEDE